MSPLFGMGFSIWKRWLPRVLLINGQSNAAAVPPWHVGYSALQQYLGSDLVGWSDKIGAYVPLVNGGANWRTNFGSAFEGPGGGMFGTVLARLIATWRGGAVKIHPAAFTSQAIAYFLPGSLTKAYYDGGSQHSSLNNYDLVKAGILASGDTLDTILFLQGEADLGRTQAAYFADLAALIEAWRLDYPQARVLLVSTIQSGNTPIHAAQAQAAATYPWVHYLDTLGLYGNTSYYDGIHYTSYEGYEELAEMALAKMRGTSRTSPAVVPHVIDVITWTHSYHQHCTVGNDSGRETMALWADDCAGAVHLYPISTAGTRLRSDPDFSGRTTTQFHPANSEAMCTADLADSSAQWTIFAVGAATGDTVHTYAVALDSAALEKRTYIDGVKTSTAVIASTTLAGPKLYVGGFGDGTPYFDGKIADVWVASGHALSDVEAVACHAWAKVEFKLS